MNDFFRSFFENAERETGLIEDVIEVLQAARPLMVGSPTSPGVGRSAFEGDFEQLVHGGIGDALVAIAAAVVDLDGAVGLDDVG